MAGLAGGRGRMRNRGMFGNVLYLDSGLNTAEKTAVYLAGPVFNIAAAAFGILTLHIPINLSGTARTVFICETEMIIYANIMLAAFNLLPFYPLDGGRTAVCLLSFFTGEKAALKAACVFSRLFAVFIFLLGIYLIKYNIINVILILDAFYFIYIFEREKNEVLR
jgi:Zn-dependent protease